MNDLEIKRINELYHKSKNEGLTNKEKAEQTKLRADYIASIKNNLKGTLRNVSILNKDGTVDDLAKKIDANDKKEKNRS